MDATVEKLKKDGLLLKQISKKEQTPEMCKDAINQNPKAFQYASRKCINAKICLAEVKKDGTIFTRSNKEAREFVIYSSRDKIRDLE